LFLAPENRIEKAHPLLYLVAAGYSFRLFQEHEVLRGKMLCPLFAVPINLGYDRGNEREVIILYRLLRVVFPGQLTELRQREVPELGFG